MFVMKYSSDKEKHVDNQKEISAMWRGAARSSDEEYWLKFQIDG
jgi:hypothetical protein